MKKRTIFYFDGFNLYHGMLRDTPQRWLNLRLDRLVLSRTDPPKKDKERQP